MTREELEEHLRRNPELRQKIREVNERQLRELDEKFRKEKEEADARRGVSRREKEVKKDSKPSEGTSDSDKKVHG